MDTDLYIEQAMEGMRTQTTAHASTWHLGQEENWSVDLNEGIIKFLYADGVVAQASIQVIGTYNTQDDTFFWGWDHPSVPEPLRDHAKAAREFGEQNNLPKFTERVVACSEYEAWEFTAVACRLAGANGAYRGPAGEALVFMTFGEVRLSKKK